MTVGDQARFLIDHFVLVIKNRFQNEEVGPFKDFLSTLKSCVSELHSALVEVNIAQLSEDILKLNLVELDNEVR